jgi:hypothetical protein
VNRSILALSAALVCGCLPLSLRAQDPAPQAFAGEEPLRLYLDCSGLFCDPDFFRTEIDFVSHVRERQDADIQLLVTQQQTGAGGREHTLSFVGQRTRAGLPEITLRYVSPPASSDDDLRRGLARTIKLGLVPFITGTRTADYLNVTYSPPAAGAAGASVPLSDPWDRWTFRVGLNGSFNGESRSNAWNGFGSLNASRVSEAWKIQLSTNGNRRENHFKVNDSTTVTSEQHGYGMNARVVRSLGRHLSAGARLGAESSTFLNQDLHVRVASALEYNLFPYSESTRRELTFQYSVGANLHDYREETIFQKTSEFLPDHLFVAALDLRQRWGTVNVAAETRQYLHDPSRYRGELFSNLDIQLIRGLSFNMFGLVSYVRDQLYLPAGDATEEEVLLRLRQLETSYFYQVSFGVSYTFGSIYNSVVNPRLNSGNY